MKNLIIIFCLFFFLLACKREKMWFNDTTVEGIVLDSATLEPVNDVEVILFREKLKYTFMGSYTKEIKIKSRKTDNNGNYIIKFNRIDDRFYYIAVKQEGYAFFYVNNIEKNMYNDEYPLEYPYYGLELDSAIKNKNIYLVK